MATRKQIAAAKRNIKKAQAANRRNPPRNIRDIGDMGISASEAKYIARSKAAKKAWITRRKKYGMDGVKG